MHLYSLYGSDITVTTAVINLVFDFYILYKENCIFREILNSASTKETLL